MRTGSLKIGDLQRRFMRGPGLAVRYRGAGGHSLLPGGYGRSTFALASSTPMAVRGAEYYVWDDEGRRLIDLNNNFTSLVHGNAHPSVTEAAVNALRSGACFGLPNDAEIRHADALLARVSHVDQVRYANSGTEAVMLAIRVARAATQRDKIVFVRDAYHGHSELALMAGGARSQRGVPPSVRADSLKLPINDLTALAAAFDQYGEQIAAIVIDPCPNRAGLVQLDEHYLRSARRLSSTHGALYISDEVIALRQHYRGAAAGSGVAPDLVVMGKIIGGGLPVGAVAGRADLMEELNPLSPVGLEHGGTFSGNPVSMAAGLRALALLTDAEIRRLNSLGDRLRTGLLPIVEERGWEVRGHGSLTRIYPLDSAGLHNGDAEKALWWHAYDRGVLLTQSGMGALSTPMNEQVIDDVIDRLGEAVEATQESGAAR